MSSEGESPAPDELDDLDKRIGDLKGPSKDRSLFVQGMGLMMSLGLTVAGTLYLGYLAGAWLKDRYHSDLLQLLALLAALGMAALGTYKLLQPWLRK